MMLKNIYVRLCLQNHDHKNKIFPIQAAFKYKIKLDKS